MKLTQSVVSDLSLPAGKRELFVWDDDVKGFGVRVRPRKRVWVVQYRCGMKQRRLTLGDVGKLDAGKARKAAKDRLAAVQLGGDPQADKFEARTRASITLGAKVEIYLAERSKDLRPSTLRAVTRYLRRNWLSLHGMPLHLISKADVAARLAELRIQNGEAAASEARGALSRFFAWSIGEGLCENNPVIGTNKPRGSKGRKRVLSDGELRAIWLALPDSDYGRIVKLAILTGQRRQEIGSMRWSELDLEGGVWTIPLARLKNHRALERISVEQHCVPLSEFTLEIIRTLPRRAGRDFLFGASEGPFKGFSVAKRGLDCRITEMTGESLKPWVLHDMRRTIDTQMGEKLGVLPHIADEVLGHIGPHKAGVRGRYNHANYEPQVAAALTLWAEHVRSVVEAGDPKVVALQARRA